MNTKEILPVQNVILKPAADISKIQSTLDFSYADDLDMSIASSKKAGAVSVVSSGNGATRYIVSLGDKKKANTDTFRKAGAAFARWSTSHSVKEYGLDLDQAILQSASPESTSAILEGLCLGGFDFDRYKTKDTPEKSVVSVHVNSSKIKNLEVEINNATIIGSSVDLARDWIHEPANSINPQTLEDRVKTVSKEFGLTVKVIQYDELVSMGAGGLTAVGKGSKDKPRLLLIEYKGAGSEAPVALVGKAITFDTGGYSLKPSEFIIGMKYDKAGGVSVLATIIAAARLKLKTNLVAIIPSAENMISSESYRPDDILKMLSGLTVEIVSTDAEGRLILADALTYAQNTYKPRAIIDIATLTGGVKIALGTRRAGLLSNSDELASVLQNAGETTGELLWRLPLDDEYFDLLKSDDADMKNSGPREAQTIVGAIFLKQFVSDDFPWAHLDIAATGEAESEKPWCGKGPNGFGVRLMLEAVKKLSK
jgi:leucyl aminopeptidase